MIATTNLFIALLAYPALSSAVLTRRQDLSGVPACGQTCLITAATNSEIVGSCSLTDLPCLCSNEKFQTSVQNCALASCSAQDQLKILTWATATCPAAASAAPASQASAPTVAVPSGVAAELAGWPACGQTCLINTGSNSEITGSCSLTDTACLCKDTGFMGAVTTCVASQCSLNDKLTMLKMSGTMCSGASGSAAAAQASPAASAKPAAQDTAEASATSVTKATPTASSAAASTAPSQTPLVDFPANTSSVASYASANSTTASSAGSPTTNLTTSSATSSAGSPTTNPPTGSVPTNATLETSPANKFSCTGFWALAFASILMTLV